ncbi:MAG TPA: TlpA disulfide reductase family protein [Thermoanaerobaculia bacterium]|nr:TlpA disulfide reductase family protein [Thermoanaerobaculia bacterium]
MRSVGTFAAAVAAIASWAMGEGPSAEPTWIDPPAVAGATAPALAAEGATTFNKEHDLLMTWLEPQSSGGRLKFARFSQGAWSPPITVAEGVAAPDPRDRPSLTVLETRGPRRTLIARTGDLVCRSADAGRAWERLPGSSLPFASFAGGEEGGYAFWLRSTGAGSARLLGTRVLAGETLLDPRASDGWATSAAMTWDGPVVAYRQAAPPGAPGIAIVRRQEARWTEPQPVHGAEWRPAEEPGSGPEVAALRRQVAAAWLSDAAHGPRLAVAFSSDAGRTFGTPVELDASGSGHEPSGPIAICLDGEGRALALWRSRSATEETLNLARVAPDGRRGDPIVVAQGGPGHFRGFPQLALVGDRVAAAWTEGNAEGASSTLRVVTVPLASLPALRTPAPKARPGDGRESYTGRGRVGDPVPDVSVRSLDGEKVSLEALRGRAVLLNLWATWCLPCIAEMPELARLQESHRQAGLVVVGLNVDAAEALDKVRAFVAERRLPFSVWRDPEMHVYEALRIQTLPATFVLDPEGRILWRADEQISAESPGLGEAIRDALASSGRAETDPPR